MFHKWEFVNVSKELLLAYKYLDVNLITTPTEAYKL